MGVSMYPGTIALERTTTSFKELAASTAVERVRPSIPALDAEYGTAPAPLLSASNEEMLMMHFVSEVCLLTRLRMEARIKALDVSMAPRRFVSSNLVMFSGSVFGKMDEMDIPAALTRTSTDSFQVSILFPPVKYVDEPPRHTNSLSNSRNHDEAVSATSPVSRLMRFSRGAMFSSACPSVIELDPSRRAASTSLS